MLFLYFMQYIVFNKKNIKHFRNTSPKTKTTKEIKYSTLIKLTYLKIYA